jgi:transcriptional regulator with XRE-family HTH domain
MKGIPFMQRQGNFRTDKSSLMGKVAYHMCYTEMVKYLIFVHNNCFNFVYMKVNNENIVYALCDRLRKLRKRLDMNIEDVAKLTCLSFGQIQRMEGDMRVKNDKVIKKGAYGRVSTLITLLVFYSKHVSLDTLFNVNIPIEDISLNKSTEKETVKEKLLSLIEKMQETVKYFE